MVRKILLLITTVTVLALTVLTMMALVLTDVGSAPAEIPDWVNYPGSEWYIDSYEMMENKKVRVSRAEAGADNKVSIEPKAEDDSAWYEIWKKF